VTIVAHDACAPGGLPFPPDHFDVVASLAVIEHLDPASLPALLAEVRRVLRPAACSS